MIADYEGDITKFLEQDFDGEMPILATRNIVLFPGVFSPIIIGRSISLNLINKIRKNPDQIFAIFCQKNQDINEPLRSAIQVRRMNCYDSSPSYFI